jgi:hypothetical protein
LDTAIIVGVMIGSVVAIVLVFGKTVLRVAWTENDTNGIQSRNHNDIIKAKFRDINDSREKVFPNFEKNGEKR